MTVFERLMFLALGGKKSYRHKKNKENKNTTKLQNLLDEIIKRKTN